MFPSNEFDVFTNGNTDAQLFQYPISRQKEIAGLFKKDVFKVVTSKKVVTHRKVVIFKQIITPKEVLNSTQVFNSSFLDKFENPDTDKVYEKNCLQAYI